MLVKNSIEHFRRLRSEITERSTFKEIVDYIQTVNIGLLPLLLCLLWVSSPIYIMAKSLFLNNHTAAYYYINRSDLGSEWYILLQQIGIAACFLAILIMYKKILCNTMPRNYLITFILNHFSALMMLLLLFWAILSTAYSNDVNLSLHGTIYRRDGLISYIAYAGVFFCGYLLNGKFHFLKVLKWFVWTSSLLAFIVLIDLEYINRLFTLHQNSAVFYNINHYAYYLCMAVMSAVAVYMIEFDSNTSRKQYLFCFILLVSALVKNRSFGPYFAVSVGLIYALSVLLFTREHLKDILKIIIIFVMISFIVNIFYGNIGTEVENLINGMYDIVQESETSGKAGSGRWELWVKGFKFMIEKPFLGYGPESLGARYKAEGISQDRPHNEFIQLAASLGIPALLFYLISLIKNFSILIAFRRSLKIEVICLNAIIVTYLISSFFGNTMFYTSPFYFMLLGITLSNTRKT